MEAKHEGFFTPEKIDVFAIPGLPEVTEGASLAELLTTALKKCGMTFAESDVVVIAQKVVSKAEGQLVDLRKIQPSAYACQVAEASGRDPRLVEVVLRESRRVVRMDAGVLVVETRHGLVCANAGVDSSNVPEGFVSLLPADPDASARALREAIARESGHHVSVIISDTFGRPWREGLTNVAIGVAGFSPLLDYRGQRDAHGHTLSATVIAAADELAAAAELVMGKTARRPAAIIRNYRLAPGEGSARELIRLREKDLFR